jgi:mRNA interferase MazF
MGYGRAGRPGGVVMTYTPKQGDIILLDFDPQSGHEQRGRRPALVVSNDTFHRRTNLAMVCPVTSTVSRFPAHVPLDGRTATTGEIMCEQTKCLDILSRNAAYKESVPGGILEEVIDIICSFIE